MNNALAEGFNAIVYDRGISLEENLFSFLQPLIEKINRYRALTPILYNDNHDYSGAEWKQTIDCILKECFNNILEIYYEGELDLYKRDIIQTLSNNIISMTLPAAGFSTQTPAPTNLTGGSYDFSKMISDTVLFLVGYIKMFTEHKNRTTQTFSVCR